MLARFLCTVYVAKKLRNTDFSLIEFKVNILIGLGGGGLHASLKACQQVSESIWNPDVRQYE